MKRYLITYTADYSTNFEIKVHFVREFESEKTAVLWSNLCSSIVLSDTVLNLVAKKNTAYCFCSGEYDFFRLTEERKKNAPTPILIDDIRKMSDTDKNRLFTDKNYYYSDDDYVKTGWSIADAYKELCQAYGGRGSFSFSILSYSVQQE